MPAPKPIISGLRQRCDHTGERARAFGLSDAARCELGVVAAFDDFGTGYSPFVRLAGVTRETSAMRAVDARSVINAVRR